MTILEISISASILILAIVVIRAVTLNRLPKKAFLVLWGVALFRLLIPFNLPSQFSIFNLAGKATHLMGTQNMNPAPNTGLLQTPIVATGDIVSAVPTSALSPFLIVWLIGMLCIALFFVITHLRYRQGYKMALPIDNAIVNKWLQEHPTKRKIQIKQSDRIKAPLTYGVLQPIILLPKAMDDTDERQLQYVLTHEYTHIKRFDILVKWLLATSVCVHWFNPLVWVMFILASRDIEISCDETVVLAFGERAKSAYALALINLEEKKSGLIPFYNSFSKNSIEERIEAIMKYKKTSAITFVVAVVLVASVITGFATSAVASDEAPAATPITISNAPDDSDNTPVTKVENAASNASESTIATLPDYEEYETFGLTYNNESGRFYLDNELVRYFEDKTLNRYFGAYEDGKDNVYAVRSADGLLTSLEVLNWEDAVFDIKYREYADFGLKFQKTDSNGLELHGKPISSFSDVAAGTGITRKNGGDGVEYEAIRDTSDPGPVGVGRLIDVRPISKN